jgi:hypothetical protein
LTLGDWALPKRIRNRNLLHVAIRVAVIALIFLVLDVVSGFGLGVALGALLFIVPAAIAASYFVSWKCDVLDVRTDGISIEGLRSSRSLPWSEIERFEIREPARRTLTMQTFRPWADQATVLLRDGSVLRIRAVQPWRGYTILGEIAVGSRTDTDDLVRWLNNLHARAGSPR